MEQMIMIHHMSSRRYAVITLTWDPFSMQERRPIMLILLKILWLKSRNNWVGITDMEIHQENQLGVTKEMTLFWKHHQNLIWTIRWVIHKLSSLRTTTLDKAIKNGCLKLTSVTLRTHNPQEDQMRYQFLWAPEMTLVKAKKNTMKRLTRHQNLSTGLIRMMFKNLKKTIWKSKINKQWRVNQKARWRKVIQSKAMWPRVIR